MINRIIELSARNRFLVLLFVTAAAATGWWSMKTIPLDAIPDLSDTQVIVYSRWDRSPDILEDQVTYPIVSAMLGAPKVKDVRGFSDFGYSYVYIIFDEGTDLYWARSRTLENLSKILPRLPQDVKTELGPDATGVGWVFQYALVDSPGGPRHNLAELRSLQDWFLRYQLQSVPGVAEVAPLGGFVRQYQVNVDPNRLAAYGVPISKVVAAVRGGNNDVGGRLVEFTGREYMVRGRGYARSTADLESISLGASPSGVPILIRDVGSVSLGPDIRRGVADLNGQGETVSGIVVIRQGENALTVIDRVKTRLKEIEPGLPPGVKVVTVYDRSELILASIDNLKHTLLEELAVVGGVILIFLWHIPSAVIPILTIPIAILIAFVPMRAMGMSANIMSLGGIAIAIGAMVDAAIVVVEQTHKKLEQADPSWTRRDYQHAIVEAVKEVGGPSFFALLVIAVSFLPVLTLEAQEGRLFKPLAYTKNLSMIVAAVLAITLDPALRILFFRKEGFRLRPRWLGSLLNGVLVGRIHSEEKHPISRVLMRAYEPVVGWCLRWKWGVILGACALVVATVPVYRQLGSEFMPPLDEGVLLFMPTTMPGISIAEAQKLMQVQDRILMRFPEVDHVLGKAGRAETSTDPAPFSMMETVVVLKPKAQWRAGISTEQLITKMNQALRIPGVSNAWTMPIKNRIDMLTTGVRTPVGIKIHGADLRVIERIGTQIERVLPAVAGTRSAFAERVGGGYFLDFDLKRDRLARYGLSVDDAQMVVMNAIGGDNVSTAIEGIERYPINVRYYRDSRSSLNRLGRALVPAMDGKLQVPLAEIATLKLTNGPSMIRNENGMRSGYVYVDVAGRDVGSYVAEARRVVSENVRLPVGYTLSWSGQFEAMERVRERLKLVLPLTLFLIFLLLYLNTRSAGKTVMILLAVPFSAVGAIWLLHLLGYNMSIGVWVGLIALMGVDAETGVFMLLYLDLAFEERRLIGRMHTLTDLREAIVQGAVKRIRPKVMTVATMFVGLAPIMWSTSAGADVMKRIAAPMIGGIFTSFLLELVVYPAIYEVWKWQSVKRQAVSS
ncbi:MAG TPA: CusA/CzcA family heavy metal efflux RND transporter [Bryobacteraceae bacterium]|nr:CusA/CzcA family heavy metal efflux RND transporter [Bryobacteraceae bacterium]